MTQQDFVLGVNYWPRQKAMYWWTDFNVAEVREDFFEIMAMRLKMVRIFLLWEDFQPAPDTVNRKALDDLRQVCDIAAEFGLSLNVTFFTGHMSGPNWVPAWLLTPGQPMPPGVRQVVSDKRVVNCGYRNPFSDTIAMEAAELLLRTVVGEFCDHPAIAVWNLGNEPDLFAHPPAQKRVGPGWRGWYKPFGHWTRRTR